MSIIKLSATDSTNAYLKALTLRESLDDFTVVATEMQLAGKGQMGAKWVSDKGKNLTISILKKLVDFNVQEQFDLNCIVSLAIYDVLHEMSVPNLSVKWPNDILSGNFKVCGILIENMLKGTAITSSILGIGLNVNQTNFENLKNASSLRLLLGQNFDLDEIMTSIIMKLKYYFKVSSEDLRARYLNVLFRKDVVSTFESQQKEKHAGIIRTITKSGKLVVEHEGELLKEYDLKEIKLLY